MGKSRIEVLVGQRFGRLAVTNPNGPRAYIGRSHPTGLRTVTFRCDCGTEVSMLPHHVVSGRVVSCGCKLRENAKKRSETARAPRDSKVCLTCGKEKPIDKFWRSAWNADGRNGKCADCMAKITRERYYDAAKAAARQRRRRQANPEKFAERERRREAQKPGRALARTKRHQEAARRRVFDHYGRECACCGSSIKLSIDHVRGNGAAHRIEIFGVNKGGGPRFYMWLIRNGFPEDFQTLCSPCNSSKGIRERCILNHSRSSSFAVERGSE